MNATIKQLPFRAAAHDLDKTLLNGSDISPENIRAVHDLVQLGLTNVVATGRNYHHAVRYHRELGLTGPLVSSDGACVSIPGGAIIQEHTIPLEVSGELLELANASGISCLCFFRHGINVTSKFDWDGNMDRHREIGKLYREVKPSSMKKRAIYKTLLFSLSPEKLDALQAQVIEKYGTVVDAIRNGPNTLELLATGVSKVSGLKTVAAHLGLDASQFVVFGDGNNDLGMFGWAGYSVCMHHGTAQARLAAKLVAPETSAEVNFAAGVAAMLEIVGKEESVA